MEQVLLRMENICKSFGNVKVLKMSDWMSVQEKYTHFSEKTEPESLH